MSCPKDTNLQVRDQFGNLIAPIVQRISKCRGRKNYYPSFTPVINTISVTASAQGAYTVVYITGSNFLPPCNGDTYVNFGSFTRLPITFYSSFNISFVVPLNAPLGIYDIRVVNIYNDNFSLPVSQSSPGIPNYSNSISYVIYNSANNMTYTISGTYVISSDSSYNTIINFTGNSVFTIYHILSNVIINYTAVGGGGGGGGGNAGGSPGAGGGGGGGVTTGTFNSTVTTYNITVGAGGYGGYLETDTPSTDGINGGQSSISGIVTVNGGIGGKASSNNGAGGNSGNGGAGGSGNTYPGGTGVNGGGGGGGAYGGGGNGGNGSVSTYYYGTSFGAGGGGGGGDTFAGNAGNSFAGNGGQPGQDATPNYGGGGGGSTSGNGIPGTYGDGGKGGSGRIIFYFNN